MKTISIVAKIAILSVCMHLSAFSDEKSKVGIQEQLGKHIPEGIILYDSDGSELKVNDYVDKPTILCFVYYHCPGICTPLLTGLSEVVDKVDLEPGKDFQILTVSFDHNETSQTAAKWKKNHLASLKRQFDPIYWRFTTGDSITIKKFTDAAGFYFKTDKEDFIHSASLIILSPQGKITRYLFGTEFLKFDLKMALLEANEGRATPTINKVLQFCFSYDREGKKYVFNVKRIAGIFLFLGIGVFFIVLVIKSRNRKIKEDIYNE